MTGSSKTIELALAGLALLLILSIAGVLSGVGNSADWLAARVPQKEALLLADPRWPTVELASLSNTWRSPLFSADRSPDLVPSLTKQESNLSGLTLTGVLLNGGIQVAFIRQQGGPVFKVYRNERLPNGWVLDSLTPLEAHFSFAGRSETLSLPVYKLPPRLIVPPVSKPDESAP